MSASPSRPPVPRPTTRPQASSAPPPPVESRPSSTPSVPVATAQAYSVTPPVIRERAPTLRLEEDDIVEAEPAGDAPRATRSSAPPPLPARASQPPPAPKSRPAPPSSRASSRVPAPPQSEVRVTGTKVPSSSHVVIPPAPPVPAELAPAPVPAQVPVAVAPPVDPARPSSLLDPTDVLFDSIYDLQFAETAWQAASVCASALASALRARAVVVHAHDIERRELRTIAAHGSGGADVLGSAEACDDDLVASAVLSNGKALTMRFDGELPRIAPKRLSVVGAKRSLVAVPALSWGRCIAVIEVVDADERLAQRVQDATAYVADHLASFLARTAA